jgi:spermidine synthase
MGRRRPRKAKTTSLTFSSGLFRVKSRLVLPWRTLDSAPTSDGSDLVLSLRDDQYAIRVDGQELMNSRSHASEEKLAVHGCAGLRGKRGVRVLIGGLGMGYTARAALDVLGPDAEVEVIELVGAVIRWNREIFGHLAGAPLDDPRLRVIEGDVVDTIGQADARYDAILLDVDNGPSALTSFKNKRLYSSFGLTSALGALRPGGMLAIWSSFEDNRFTALLRKVGFQAEAKRVLADRGRTRRHVVWLARAVPPRVRRRQA